MRSMTGYGGGKGKNKKAEVCVEIKSHNFRFLDIEVNLPRDVPIKWEEKIKNRIKETIKRGKVTVYVKIEKRGPVSFKVTVNQEIASCYHQALSQLSKKLGLKENVGLSHLLTLPEIIKLDNEEIYNQDLEDLLDEALTEALKELLYMRKREGEKHHQDIQKCLRRIEDNLLEIEKQAPLVREGYRQRIREEIKKFLKEEEDKEKIANEISVLINRGDINEEVVRFRSHLDQFKRTIEEDTPVGKKLGFILQELQGEINTVGAKLTSLPISYPVIRIKEEIERIREQVQNIE